MPGNGVGVRGSILSGNGVGVTGDSGFGNGVVGSSGNGNGVVGSSASGFGVYGTSSTGRGVVGTSGGAVGLWGESTGSYAIRGESISPAGHAGVLGINNTSSGIGVLGTGGTYGVYGGSPNTGVTGTGNVGVSGTGGTHGVYGFSTVGNGVYGESQGAKSATTAGVFGKGTADGTQGVIGESGTGTGIGVFGVTYSSTGFALYGRAAVAGGTALYTEGDAHIQGTLTKTAGSFKIDHPLDPTGKYLYHSFVESPDMKNIYDGNITTDANGRAEVVLPDWFEALNKDFRYQLTVIGQFAQAIVAETVHDNQFQIATNIPNVRVSWQVTGIRKDAYAESNRIPTEELKPEGKPEDLAKVVLSFFLGFIVQSALLGEVDPKTITKGMAGLLA